MRKQFAMVMLAIILLSALMVSVVMSRDEDTANLSKTDGDSTFKYISDEKGKVISITIAYETNVSEREHPVSIAATSDFAATRDLVGKIAFVSDRDGDDEIYVMDADGTNVTKLTSNTATDWEPGWSPACKKIAFGSDRDGDFEIYVMDAEGTNVTKLTSNTASDEYPSWLPDGSKIAFHSMRDGDDEIYVMDADGTNVTKLTSNTATDWCSSSVWSPDGSKLVDASWPMYGHDSAHTSRSPVNGPTYPDLRWTYNLEVDVQDSASPVIGPDGTVYMPSECGFFAINPDGTLKWKKWGTGWDFTLTRMAPAVANDGTAVYVYATHFPIDRLYAINPVNGDTIWFYDIGYSTYGSPTIGSDGTIYVGGCPDPGGTSYMYAINIDGTLKWRWDSETSGCWIETSPVIGPNGEVYFQHNCLGLVALESNGQFKWSHNGGLGQAWNSPSIGPDGTIYIGSSDYYFHALNPDGTDKWEVRVDNWMYEAASAISSDGSTIYRGDNGGIFYAFDKSGYIKWKYDTGIDGTITCAPALAANGIIYFTQGWTTAVEPNDKGYLYALRASDGALLWKYEKGWSSSSPAIAADGTLYAVGQDASGNGVLLCLPENIIPCLADTAVYKAGVPNPEAILNPLRELRDTYLKDEYVDRYYDYSHELAMVITRDPALAHEAARLLVKYSHMVRHHVYGIGVDKLITRRDVKKIVSFTDSLERSVLKNRDEIGAERTQEIIIFLDEFKEQVKASESKTFSEALQGSIYCKDEQMPDPDG